MKKSKTTTNEWLGKRYPVILFGSALFALIASFWQAAERINMLKNPTVSLSCNLNPIVDCGGVMDHKLAALFGFPNTFIGMVMFSMLAMAGLLLIFDGKFTAKFHKVVLGLSSVAILFSAWFFWASLFVIGKICIFCLAIWPASVILFWYGLLYWFSKQDKLSTRQQKIYNYGLKNHIVVVLYVLLLMFAIFMFRFREYYFS